MPETGVHLPATFAKIMAQFAPIFGVLLILGWLIAQFKKPHVKGKIGEFGEAEIKTKDKLPDSVMTGGTASWIKRHDAVLFSDAEVETLSAKLAARQMPKDCETREAHLRSLEERHGRQGR